MACLFLKIYSSLCCNVQIMILYILYYCIKWQENISDNNFPQQQLICYLLKRLSGGVEGIRKYKEYTCLFSGHFQHTQLQPKSPCDIGVYPHPKWLPIHPPSSTTFNYHYTTEMQQIPVPRDAAVSQKSILRTQQVNYYLYVTFYHLQLSITSSFRESSNRIS